MTSRLGRALATGALALASLLGALVLLEALLQAGAVVVRATGRTPAGEFETEGRRILCLGDSNTYGIYLDRDRTYPHRLQVAWNEARPADPIEVLNLGYPGTNSSFALRELPRALDRLEPEAVLVLVGINDFWTVEASPREPGNAAAGAATWVRETSRVYRLFALLRQRLDRPNPWLPSAPDGIVPKPFLHTVHVGPYEFQLGFAGRRKGTPDDVARLAENLEQLVALTRASGASAVLMTYPVPKIRQTTSSRLMWVGTDIAIRRVARRTGAPLIDLRRLFTERCAGSDCDELLFSDDHPNERGAELIAQTIAARLPGLLEPR